MKLKCRFEAVDMGDEVVCVPVGKNADQVQGVLKLNKEGYEILKLLQKNTTCEKIADNLCSRFENDRQEMIGYIQDTIEALRKAGLILE